MDISIRLLIVGRKDQPIRKIKLTRKKCDAINTESLKGFFVFCKFCMQFLKYLFLPKNHNLIAGVISVISFDNQDIPKTKRNFKFTNSFNEQN